MPGETPEFGSRRLFPELESAAYLSFAGISPTSTVVREAMLDCLSAFGRAGLPAFGEQVEVAEAARASFGRLIGTGSEHLACMPNTSQGVITVAQGLDLKPGDRILLFKGEFPTNVVPWISAARERGLEIVTVDLEAFLRSTEEGLELVRAELLRGVALVAVSAVQFQTGLRMPLRELGAMCRVSGALLFVDAVQAVGATPLDVGRDGIHFLACGSHKWLNGPLGGGFLYVAPEVRDRLRVALPGWMSLADPLGFLFAGGPPVPFDEPLGSAPRALETGVLNLPGFAGLRAAMDLLVELGPERIHAHVNLYLDILEDAALGLGYTSARTSEVAGRSTILALRPPPRLELGQVLEALTARGITVSAPDGWLRFAPHWPNPLQEADEVAARLAEI